MAEHVDLRRNLGPANDCGDRTLRGVESKLQCTDLLDACGRKAAGRTP
ncbi:MAG: hypothetical protein WA579_09725 [Rhodomicrobium sp.]